MVFARQGLTPGLAATTAAELIGWLDRHVRTTDRALGAWARSRGRA
jgi:hemerythrin